MCTVAFFRLTAVMTVEVWLSLHQSLYCNIGDNLGKGGYPLSSAFDPVNCGTWGCRFVTVDEGELMFVQESDIIMPK